MKYLRPLCFGLALLVSACSSIDRLPLRQQKSGSESFERITILGGARGRFPLGIAAAKLSAKSVPDLAMTSWGDIGKEMLGGIGEGTVSVLFGTDAQGRLLSTKDEYPVGLGASGIAIADLNNDGKLDLAIAATNGITGFGQQPGLPGQIWIYYGNGDGTFAKPRIERSPIPFPETITVGDLNNDGYADIIIGIQSAKAVAIFWGGPNDTLRPITIPLAGTSQSIAVGRFTDKANIDIAILGRKGPVDTDTTEPNLSILFADGRGGFRENRIPLEAQKGNIYESIASGDFNGDGLDDIIVHSRKRLFVYAGRQSQLPSLIQSYSGDFAGGAVQIADFDRDGKLDILIPVAPYGLSVLFGNGDGAFSGRLDLEPVASPRDTAELLYALHDFGLLTSPITNRVVSAVADIDGDGYPDIIVALSSLLLAKPSSTSAETVASSGTSLIVFKNRLRR